RRSAAQGVVLGGGWRWPPPACVGRLASLHEDVPPEGEDEMTTVLVVEDEIEIARIVRDYLRNAGFEVIVVGDGGSAVASVRSAKPDLLVLDLGLPGQDGLDVAREIRRWSNTPIVMLTPRGDETERIVGLEIGADDYVVKPFSPKELVARVRAVLRRTRTAARGDEVVRAGDVEIDTAKMRVSVGGTQVDLTPTEFQLLATLAREPGRVFTRSQLLDAVHGVAIESYERAIDAHVKNIRRKIEPEPGSPRYVVTVHGVGYRFAAPQPPASASARLPAPAARRPRPAVPPWSGAGPRRRLSVRRCLPPGMGTAGIPGSARRGGPRAR